MSGATLQLTAWGTEDAPLTASPEMTYFKIGYKRHSLFAMTPVVQSLGPLDFGKEVNFQIDVTGDMIHRMYLQLNITGADTGSVNKKWGWVDSLGHAIIECIDIKPGNTSIDKHYGDWLHVWNSLSSNKGQENGYDRLIGNTSPMTKLVRNHSGCTIYIPFQFFFNRSVGLSLPVVGMYGISFFMNIRLRALAQCINRTANVSVSDLRLSVESANLIYDAIFLDMSERKTFTSYKQEYLVELLQCSANNPVTSVATKLTPNFSHPVKFMIWHIKMGKYNTGKKFLGYDSNNWEDMIKKATARFCLSLAKTINREGVLMLDLPTNSGFIQIDPAIVASRRADLVELFNLAHPYAINTELDVDNVQIMGSYLTLDKVSTPVDILFADVQSVRDHKGDGSPQYDIVLYQWDNYGMFIDKSKNPISYSKIFFSNGERLPELPGTYYNLVQPYQHFTNTPPDGINVYSFAIYPEKHQPSGSANFSRFESIRIECRLGDDDVNFKTTYLDDDTRATVYCVGYNLFRLYTGLAGLAYAQ
uniref:Putative major capsid protein n=2 Tax=White sturgeon epivirus TaxID=329359 RepID=B8K2X0_9VIRU|nr:putative major capsid protein [White sturgeon epivirus]